MHIDTSLRSPIFLSFCVLNFEHERSHHGLRKKRLMTNHAMFYTQLEHVLVSCVHAYIQVTVHIVAVCFSS